MRGAMSGFDMIGSIPPVILGFAQRSPGIHRKAPRFTMDPGAAPLSRLVQDDAEDVVDESTSS